MDSFLSTSQCALCSKPTKPFCNNKHEAKCWLTILLHRAAPGHMWHASLRRALGTPEPLGTVAGGQTIQTAKTLRVELTEVKAVKL